MKPLEKFFLSRGGFQNEPITLQPYNLPFWTPPTPLEYILSSPSTKCTATTTAAIFVESAVCL